MSPLPAAVSLARTPRTTRKVEGNVGAGNYRLRTGVFAPGGQLRGREGRMNTHPLRNLAGQPRNGVKQTGPGQRPAR